MSRRERADRLKRLLGRDPPSYAARASLRKKIDTLAREHRLLQMDIKKCEESRAGTMSEDDRRVLMEVEESLGSLAARYESGLQGLRR